MKRIITLFLLFTLLLAYNVSFAEKPYSEWSRADIMTYFEANNIIFEGEYNSTSNNQNIIIGRLNSKTETVSMNFFVREGKLVKALLTTSDNITFQSLQTRVEDQGFEKVSESNDQLGNQYKKYHSGSVELTVVNKNADWPEVYFQP
jgi:hypothetical protein